MTRDELSRVLAICKDEATLEYERAQEMLMSMRETTVGYAALALSIRRGALGDRPSER